MAKNAKAIPAQAAEVPAVPATLRLPLGEARAHNAQFLFVQDDKVVAAGIALTAKATNPKKARVYGYDNLGDGGGVPKDKRVLMVPGFSGVPKGVTEAQWDKVVVLAGTTVSGMYDQGVTSRTVRRAYRAGAIRFAA